MTTTPETPEPDDELDEHNDEEPGHPDILNDDEETAGHG